ncbi:adenosylmethionine decarboxylase [Butyrivibrio sp. NC3005]|uniref:adenosylmethionine decarboxylase n=1 Tax=Butyrivibrio sp. NC3005 TaxID=1280685 RepID=UPI000415F33D|nr:adenosylmethionine decarboxylase [Butyrivibrio sp. NC3005]
MAVQITADFYGCDEKILDSEVEICNIARDAIKSIKAEIVEECIHKFQPIGITYFAIISTSHFSIHTWPEYGYAAIDVFSCSEFIVEELTDMLKKALKADRIETNKIDRKVGK